MSRLHTLQPDDDAPPATMFVFDVLRVDGRDVRSRPYLERRAILAAAAPPVRVDRARGVQWVRPLLQFGGARARARRAAASAPVRAARHRPARLTRRSRDEFGLPTRHGEPSSEVLPQSIRTARSGPGRLAADDPGTCPVLLAHRIPQRPFPRRKFSFPDPPKGRRRLGQLGPERPILLHAPAIPIPPVAHRCTSGLALSHARLMDATLTPYATGSSRRASWFYIRPQSIRAPGRSGREPVNGLTDWISGCPRTTACPT
jgi:hypothetical protein